MITRSELVECLKQKFNVEVLKELRTSELLKIYRRYVSSLGSEEVSNE